MRDPARIEPILRRVYLIWKQNPDMRLLQLLMKVAESGGVGNGNVGGPRGTTPSYRYFHFEDASLASALKQTIETDGVSIVDQLAALEDPGELFVQR